MNDLDLESAAARYALGELHSWVIPPVATRALEQGYYSESLTRLVGLPHPRMDQAGPLFEAACRECGVAIPDEAGARRFLAGA